MSHKKGPFYIRLFDADETRRERERENNRLREQSATFQFAVFGAFSQY